MSIPATVCVVRFLIPVVQADDVINQLRSNLAEKVGATLTAGNMVRQESIQPRWRPEMAGKVRSGSSIRSDSANIVSMNSVSKEGCRPGR